MSSLIKAKEFVDWDINAETKSDVQNLIEKQDYATIEKLFGTRVAFGTAGLRAEMGAGYSRINDLVILQTCQGILKYIIETCGIEAYQRGVVIGYDHRCKNSLSSKRFARICASVFLHSGFKIYLLEDFVATPLVSFAVVHLKCIAGFMVTASHNPAKDNGFKIYWSNGAQIIPPHDIRISESILRNLEPFQKYDIDNIESHSLVEDVTEKVSDMYFKSLPSLSYYRERNVKSQLRVVYTAMHGVGYKWIQKAFQAFNHIELLPVPSQMFPDPTFPTVSFPNPEEKGALNEAMMYAESEKSTLIIANDPDADRLAVAERILPYDTNPTLEVSNETKKPRLFDPSVWKVFTGNEIGALLGHWVITQYKAAMKPTEEQNSTYAVVLASIVSSRMLKRIAEYEKIDYCDTLTGFKWLANKSQELRSTGAKVLFSYEEALGYCIGDLVRDKDGLSAAAVCVELATHAAAHHKSLCTQLMHLDVRYGACATIGTYLSCSDTRVTNAIFDRLRRGGADGGYWLAAAGARIVALKDITHGFDSAASDGRAALPVTPDGHMLTFDFDNGVTFTLRTSGTEPKIKLYAELAGAPGELSREELEKRLRVFVDALIEEMLQPEKNGLSRPLF